MDIARQKRDENIAEYILYIWQLEDLVRALGFDRHRVYENLVVPREATDEWKLAALDWYMEIADLLVREGKADGGHLDHTLHLIGEMNDLHLMLLEQPAGQLYRKVFARLAPSLAELRATMERNDISDIEIAFRTLYAAMLYKMKGVHAEVTDEVVSWVSPVVALLADIYHKVERGEIDLYRDNA
jgi:hypothetical protein